MLAKPFAARVWTALVNPIGGSVERRPLPSDASDGARIWAALTQSGGPVVDAYRHGSVRRDRRHAAKRFAGAADRLASDVMPVQRWQAIADLVELADDDEFLRQACVDLLCEYVRASSFRAEESEVRHQVVDLIASRLNGHAVSAWPRCVFNLAGASVESIDFSGTWIDELVDFSHCQFDEGKTSFANARFSGKAVFADSQFSGACVDFSHAQFDGSTDFSGSTFESGVVTFAGARFRGEVDFSGCAFVGADVDFRDAEFDSGRVDFTDSSFKAGDLNFTGAHFKGGTVDLRSPRVTTSMPVFDEWAAEPPPGLLLPDMT